MPASLRVPHAAHLDFSALPAVRVMESFSYADSAFAGVHNGVWFYDEWYWSERKGAWGGVLPMPARESVGALRLVDTAREVYNGAGCDEPLDRVASGTPLVVKGEILYRYNFYDLGVPDHPNEARLYSCATGALVATAGDDGKLGIVADGSYLLWARVFAGTPFETGFGLARIKDGEWSVLRVVVGSGEWSRAAGVSPSPGCPLYRKSQDSPPVAITDANEFIYRFAFDPLARAVSASCVLDAPILHGDGSVDVPAGALLLGGLRASSNGPQTALWWMRDDDSVRLLALQTRFTDGVCECAKTNHAASDVVQAPTGELYVLTECALFRYDPMAPTLFERLPGFPSGALTPDGVLQSQGAEPEAGHPGGNCLRCPGENEEIHWTENLDNAVNDGTPWYNRMVRRVGGRDLSGPSTLWHGTNCAEIYLGRFWAIRADDATQLFLDWLDNGRWHGFGGMTRSTLTHFWQRLRAANDKLFVFGFKPATGAALALDEAAHSPATQYPKQKPKVVNEAPDSSSDSTPHDDDQPLCAIADGNTLKEAVFPYFIRRATPCGALGKQTLFVTARAAADGIGPANRVIEILASSTRICSFWNDEHLAFEMSRAAFVSLGGDVAKIPPIFAWFPQSGRNGGGVWKAATVAPTTGPFLHTFLGRAGLVCFELSRGPLPYNPLIWGELCFEILADGSVDGPFVEPTCLDAACALAFMPPNTRFRVIERPTPNANEPQTALQVTDASHDRRLSSDRDLYPCLWLRHDSGAPSNDLASYTRLVSYGQLETLLSPAKTRVQVVVLIPPESSPLEASEIPILSRRA